MRRYVRRRPWPSSALPCVTLSRSSWYWTTPCRRRRAGRRTRCRRPSARSSRSRSCDGLALAVAGGARVGRDEEDRGLARRARTPRKTKNGSSTEGSGVRRAHVVVVLRWSPACRSAASTRGRRRRSARSWASGGPSCRRPVPERPVRRRRLVAARPAAPPRRSRRRARRQARPASAAFGRRAACACWTKGSRTARRGRRRAPAARPRRTTTASAPCRRVVAAAGAARRGGRGAGLDEPPREHDRHGDERGDEQQATGHSRFSTRSCETLRRKVIAWLR